jgi:2'-5' RNA ligase
MESIRCFIAIELPAELKAELTRLQNKLRSATGGNCARWVESSGIHLTLKFLGNVPRGKIDEIVRAMEEAVKDLPELKFEVSDCGCFPNMHRPQVVWVGLTGDTKTLGELVKRLEDALTKLGFKPEGRPFTPHLTLARVRDTATPAERQALGEAISRAELGIISGIIATGICLMQSELTPKGAIYTRLAEIKLKKTPKTG